jgi:DNA polymerase III epsilon subunit-like protein
MCVTKNGLELTRVSILNGQGLCVYDKLVKPVDLIIDYATQYSGITKHMLENVTDTLLDNVHRDLFTSDDALIDEATIVVGHSIENDLKALKVLHRRVIDSAIVYPHPRGPPYRSALRFLTKKWLGRKIQQGDTTTGGHDSAEDALGALDLVLMKYRCGPTFGTTDVTEKGESIFRWMEREGSQSSSLAGEEEEEESGGGGGGRGGGGGGGGGGTKRCAIVGDPMSIRKYMEGGVDAIVANGNDDQIVSKSIKCLTSHRLVCTILSEADDLDMERAQKMKDARRRGEEEKEVEKEEGEEEGTPKSSSSSELLSLVSELTCSPLQQQRMDSHVRSIYNAMPSNGLLIVCMQGGVHSSNQLRTASELTPADHAVICFAVRESVSQTTEVEKTW